MNLLHGSLHKLKEVGKPDKMAGNHNLSILSLFKKKKKNSVKIGDFGTEFALSLSLIIYKRLVVSRNYYFFSQIEAGALLMGVFRPFLWNAALGIPNISFTGFCKRLKQPFL